MTQLFVHSGIPGLDIINGSIKPDVQAIKVSNDDFDFTPHFDSNVSRIGLLYHNTRSRIPFGKTRFTDNGYRYRFFSSELVNYLKSYSGSLTLDLLTCNMTDKTFINEVSKLKTLIPNVTIEYSLNQTGGSVNADWIMESSNVSVKDLYFTDGISNYTFSLGTNSDHSAIVTTDGSVWTSGFNGSGALGLLGVTDTQGYFMQVVGDSLGSTFFTDAIAVATGNDHTVILKSDGTVWACGRNNSGQLGDGDSPNNKNYPVQVLNISNAIAIAAGANHTVILKSDGTVWACGLNIDGQLGNGNNMNQDSVVQVGSITNGKDIAAAQDYTVIVTEDGCLWACGANNDGGLGLGYNINDTNVPIKSELVTDAVRVGCGIRSTYIVKSDGTACACGSNNDGELSINELTLSETVYAPIPMKQTDNATLLTNVVRITGGSSHCIILKSDHTVWFSGYNSDGQAGGAILVGDSTTYAVQIPSITNAIAATSGEDFTGILLDGGIFLAAGINDDGQLGTGDNDDKDTFTQTLFAGSPPEEVTNGFRIYNIPDTFPFPTTTIPPTTTPPPTTTESPDNEIIEVIDYWQHVIAGLCAC